MEHVCSAFCFGSENQSWSQATLDRITGRETKARRRLFSSKKGRRRDVGTILHKDGEDCKNDVDKDEAANSI